MGNISSVCFHMAKNGDIEAFEQLIDAYQKRVYNLALKVAGDRNDASKLAQEVFIRVYKSLNHIDEEHFLAAWIYKAAADVCLDDERRLMTFQQKIQ